MSPGKNLWKKQECKKLLKKPGPSNHRKKQECKGWWKIPWTKKTPNNFRQPPWKLFLDIAQQKQKKSLLARFHLFPPLPWDVVQGHWPGKVKAIFFEKMIISWSSLPSKFSWHTCWKSWFPFWSSHIASTISSSAAFSSAFWPTREAPDIADQSSKKRILLPRNGKTMCHALNESR